MGAFQQKVHQRHALWRLVQRLVGFFSPLLVKPAFLKLKKEV